MEEIEVQGLGRRSNMKQSCCGNCHEFLAVAILNRPSNLKRLVFKDATYNFIDVDSARFVCALNKIGILEVQLERFKVNLLPKAMM